MANMTEHNESLSVDKKIANTVLKMLHHSQTLTKNKKAYAEKIMTIYKKLDKDSKVKYLEALRQGVKSVMLAVRSSLYTKRTIKFLAIYFKAFSQYEHDKKMRKKARLAKKKKLPEEQNQDDDDNTVFPCKFLEKMITKELSNWTACTNANIRYNAASLIHAILEEFEEIEANMFDHLVQVFCARSFHPNDKMLASMSIMALTKLQEPEESQEAFKAVKFHLRNNPSNLARVCAIRSLIVAKQSKDDFVRACRDVSASVRKYAYRRLATFFKMSNFDETTVERLLLQGIKDTAPGVREIVSSKLIPEWIAKTKDKSLAEFVRCLPAKCHGPVLEAYFDHLLSQVHDEELGLTELHQFTLQFKQEFLSPDTNLLKKEHTGGARFVLWFHLEYFCLKHKLTYKVKRAVIPVPSEFGSQEEFEQAEHDPYDVYILADQIFPQVATFCEYVDKFVKFILAVGEQDGDNQDRVDNFIVDFNLLLDLFYLLEIVDQAQWQRVWQTFSAIIKNDKFFLLIPHECIKKIMLIFSNYFGHDEPEFLNVTLDLVNALNEPSSSQANYHRLHCELVELDELIAMKLEELKYPYNETDRRERAQELEGLESKKKQILEEQNTLGLGFGDDYDGLKLQMEAQVDTHERLILILYGYLWSKTSKRDNSRLPSIIHEIVVPGLNKKHVSLVENSLRTLHAYCQVNIERTNKYIHLFVELIYNQYFEAARVLALECLFDLVQRYDFNQIVADYVPPENKTAADHEKAETRRRRTIVFDAIRLLKQDGVLGVVLHLARDILFDPPRFNEAKGDESTASAKHVKQRMFETMALGVMRLFYHGKFSAPLLLAQLIVLAKCKQYEPASLKAKLNMFIPAYAVEFHTKLRGLSSKGSPFVRAFPLVIATIFKERLELDRDGFDDVCKLMFDCTPAEFHLDLAAKACEMLKTTETFREIDFVESLFKYLNTIKFDQSLMGRADEVKKLQENFSQFVEEYGPAESRTRSKSAVMRFKEELARFSTILEEEITQQPETEIT